MSIGKEAYILSLGGSLVVPNTGIDVQFLTAFNTFVRDQISSKKRRFFIVVGGGTTARQYRDAGESITHTKLSNEDLDWLGIHATRLNAHLVRTIFRDIAHSHVIKHYEIIRKVDEPVVVAAGWKPGWSTDYCAVTLCQDYGVSTVFNLTNIDKVYDKDPRKHPEAKPIDHLSWKTYCEMSGDTWIPGMNMPFDPVASKLALELSVKVVIINGKNLENLGLALDSKPFFGTTIE